jgi:hypothetical protein
VRETRLGRVHGEGGFFPPSRRPERSRTKKRGGRDGMIVSAPSPFSLSLLVWALGFFFFAGV